MILMVITQKTAHNSTKKQHAPLSFAFIVAAISTTSCRRLAVLMSISVLFPILQSCDEPPAAPIPTAPRSLYEKFCRGNESQDRVPDREVHAVDSSGVTPDAYFISDLDPVRKPLDQLSLNNIGKFDEDINKGKREEKPEDKSEKKPEGLEEFIGRESVAKLTDLAVKPNVWYSDDALLQEKFKDPAVYRKILDHDTLLSGFVRVAANFAYVNCKTREYVYSVSYAIPRQPLDALPEMQTIINNQAFPALQRLLAPINNGSRVSVEIPGDLRYLAVDQRSQKELAGLISKYHDKFMLLDKPTRNLVEWLAGKTITVAPFVSADFTLRGDMITVTDILAKAFVHVRRPGRTYEIRSIGAADSRPLTGTLPYSSGADLTLPLGRVADFSEAVKNDTVTSNDHLSIARGFAGAEEFARSLKLQGFPLDSQNLKLRYGGKGSVPGVPLDTNRRIEIVFCQDACK